MLKVKSDTSCISGRELVLEQLAGSSVTTCKENKLELNKGTTNARRFFFFLGSEGS